MRDYSFNPKTSKWQLYYNYIMQLDQQVWNLYDYIKEYNPNYQILNDSNNYYSTDDLNKLELYNNTTHIINASYLNRHQGLLNNFHQNCLINFTAQSNVEKIVVPAFNIHTILNPKNVSYMEAVPGEAQPQSIYDLQWRYPDQIILPEGYILLSEVKSNTWSKSSNERHNIKNYLFARVAAPATYYLLNNITAIDNDTHYTWTYTPNAELTHGVSQYYSFLPHGVNFYYYQPYNAPRVEKRQGTTIKSSQILTQDGSQWVEGYALNHRLINNNTYEEIIYDDTREIDTIVENNTAIAHYNIAIKNNKEPFLESFPMMVRLW